MLDLAYAAAFELADPGWRSHPIISNDTEKIGHPRKNDTEKIGRPIKSNDTEKISHPIKSNDTEKISFPIGPRKHGLHGCSHGRFQSNNTCHVICL